MPISIVNPNIQEPVSNIEIISEDRIDQGINIATMVVSWTQAKVRLSIWSNGEKMMVAGLSFPLLAIIQLRCRVFMQATIKQKLQQLMSLIFLHCQHIQHLQS